MSERKPFKKFHKRETSLTIEQKIKRFILRNSQSGFFTKISTIPYKFEISESKAWDVVGELLSDGALEAIHDEFTGEMKLCEIGKTYSIMDLERKRKRQKFVTHKRKPKQKSDSKV